MPEKYCQCVDQPTKIDLSKFDPGPPKGIGKEQAAALTESLSQEMEELFDLLFYAADTPLLIVLQGMDTSGKDGTIRHILNHSNAQSTRVAPFKVPTQTELAHDYLWRVHQEAPGKGGITIFNRSHYEDVLVVRVHNLVDKTVWSQRYAQINQFESLLASAGTKILKFFLHISKDEQEQRLLEREQDVTKSWKLSAGDWKERSHWDDYQEAYGDAIGKCASETAPWFVVPSDHKWFRNLAVTQTIVDALKPLKSSWMNDLEEVGKQAKAELAEYRNSIKR